MHTKQREPVDFAVVWIEKNRKRQFQAMAFMSLESLNEMLNDIRGEVDIGVYDVLSAYDPGDLRKTADGFDRVLRQYLQECENAGLHPARYAGVDAFVSAYLTGENR